MPNTKQAASNRAKTIPEAPENQLLGDWIAPIFAFVSVGTMLFAVVWILLSPAQ
jgi:hypothetical protein